MAETGQLRISRRQQRAGRRPLFTADDAWFLAELPVLMAIATLGPERRWAALCGGLERAKAALGRFSPETIRRGFRAIRADGLDTGDPFAVAAARSEHHLQILRELAWGWSAPIELIGAEHVRRALDRGRGAVLWVAHFSFNALAVKKAFHAAAFPVWHLSRPEHGFSKSRFGIAVLNPMRSRVELRFLRGRIVIDRASPQSAVRQARKRLKANEIVSVTAGAWEGGRIATVTIGGCDLDLATGAPGLAYLTGAPLVPVFAIRHAGSPAITVIAEAPIAVDRDRERDRAVLDAAQAFADRALPYVVANPSQWRDWEKIRPAASTPRESP